ncbi:hypothetical protein LXL04_037114 [Taraxacum kok-saghyz]
MDNSPETKTKASTQYYNGREEVSNIATNVFVSNIPENWNSSALWKAVHGVRVLVDAYVPRKMEKGGTRFGFVRFIRVQNKIRLLRSLNDMVFEGRRLKANIAKYGRKSGDGNRATGSDAYGRKINGRPEGGGNRHANIINRGTSFKEMLVGRDSGIGEVRLKKNGVANMEKKIIIPQGVNIRSMDRLICCLVGEIKDIELLSKCMSMIHSYGLGDCTVKYIGGLCALLEFKIEKVNWCAWFAWLKRWDESFRVSSRVVWLRIYGVPVNCWDPTIFTYIANNYGRILLPFDCSVEAINLSFGRICILTANLEHLKAHSCCVEWRNEKFKVRIEEDGEWYPNSLLVPSEFDSEDEDDMGFDDLRDSNSEDGELENIGDLDARTYDILPSKNSEATESKKEKEVEGDRQVEGDRNGQNQSPEVSPDMETPVAAGRTETASQRHVEDQEVSKMVVGQTLSATAKVDTPVFEGTDDLGDYRNLEAIDKTLQENVSASSLYASLSPDRVDLVDHLSNGDGPTPNTDGPLINLAVGLACSKYKGSTLGPLISANAKCSEHPRSKSNNQNKGKLTSIRLKDVPFKTNTSKRKIKKEK